MSLALDKLMIEIESLGYTVETFTNEMGTRFTYVLWKRGAVVGEDAGIVDQSLRTWSDLEPMYSYILSKLPKPPRTCQSVMHELRVMCMGKVNHEGLHFATGVMGGHRFYLQWNSGPSWSEGQLARIQLDISYRRS